MREIEKLRRRLDYLITILPDIEGLSKKLKESNVLKGDVDLELILKDYNALTEYNKQCVELCLTVRKLEKDNVIAKIIGYCEYFNTEFKLEVLQLCRKIALKVAKK